GNTSYNQKHHINISGGTERTNYYLSGGFVDQNGVYKYGNDNYRRLNFLSNLNSQVTDWLNVRTGVKYAKGLADYPVGQTTVGREHMMGEVITFAPMMPMYNINRKSTRLNSSHVKISYAVFCLKKKTRKSRVKKKGIVERPHSTVFISETIGACCVM